MEEGNQQKSLPPLIQAEILDGIEAQICNNDLFLLCPEISPSGFITFLLQASKAFNGYLEHEASKDVHFGTGMFLNFPSPLFQCQNPCFDFASPLCKSNLWLF